MQQNPLNQSQLEWLRANVDAFAHVEKTCGDVQREARGRINQQRCPKGWDQVTA